MTAFQHACIFHWTLSDLKDAAPLIQGRRGQPNSTAGLGYSPVFGGQHILMNVLGVKKESEVAQSSPTVCDPWTVAHQASPSMGFSRQEYWSGLPFPSPIFRTNFLQDRLVGSPCSTRDSQESSPTPWFKSINSSVFIFLYGPTLSFPVDVFKSFN